MKKLFLLLIIFLSSQISHGLDKIKFGTVSLEELKMAKLPSDTLASAVVLYEYCDNYYSIGTKDFILISEYTVRIKIFTSEGLDNANHSFLLRKGRSREYDETYSGLTGYTYNLENGKIVKEKLDKNYIFTEETGENLKRIKFALPSVKPGSVIEYKYTIASPYYTVSRKYHFQRDIPVDYSCFSIKIPEYFRFDRETTGYEHIAVNIKRDNQSFSFGQNHIQCTAELIIAEVYYLPALKKDNYVFCREDFLSGIKFELRSIIVPGNFNKDFSTTWNDVAKQLMESKNFGEQLKHKNLFKSELAAIAQPDKTDREKLRDILDMVRNKVNWNKNSTSYIKDAQKALKEGVGSSAEINALLICALKDAGFNAYPVLMRLRSSGRLPITHPSDQFNYFVAGITSNNNTYYLDATRPYTDINVLPTDCLVDKAFYMQPQKNDWVDLGALTNNGTKTTLHISFNDDTGILEGTCVHFYNNASSYRFQREYTDAKDQDDYIRTMEEKSKIKVADYKTDIVRNNTGILSSENYQFTYEDISLNNHSIISFSPLLYLKMENNPFKAEKRNLPVEFSYPYENRTNIRIILPEGYAFDEIPKSVKFVCNDKDGEIGSFTCLVKQEENVLSVSYMFNLNTNIIPGIRYPVFREFYSNVYSKTNEPIVIKKIKDN